MKIFVCVKQVPDTETKIQIKSDASGIEENGIKWVMNPYDEIAVEEALKLKTAQGDATVTVVTVGPKKRAVDTLRTALAMGADDAIVVDAAESLDSLTTAKALAAAIKKEDASGFVFTGKLAIDDNSAAVGQMLAQYLEIPHASVVSKFTMSGDHAVVEREIEGGAKEVFKLQAPCLIAATKGLNTPRYASLPGIMKAKKKPVKEYALADLGLSDGSGKVRYSQFQPPPEKPPVKMLGGDADTQVKELVQLLMNEAKVL